MIRYYLNNDLPFCTNRKLNLPELTESEYVKICGEINKKIEGDDKLSNRNKRRDEIKELRKEIKQLRKIVKGE